MKSRRIKGDWASLVLADDGNVIVCVKSRDSKCCMRFGSLEQLKQAVDGKKISVRRWAIVVMRQLCILKPLALPASGLGEAAKMVEFELSCLVPLPIEEIVYGCTSLNQHKNILNVLICILKLSSLNQILETYRAIGIQPDRVILNSLAVQSWFNTINEGSSGPRMNIFVDNSRCIVSAGLNGNLQEVTELDSGGKDFEVFSREILGEILHRREEMDCSVKEGEAVLLAGRKECVLEVKKLLDESCNGSAFGEVSIAEKHIIWRGGGEEESQSDDFHYEAVTATGVIEAVGDARFQYSNLLPQQYLKKARQKTLLFNYVITGVMSAALVLLLWFCLAAANWRIERQCRKIEASIAPIKHIAALVDSKRQRVKAIQKQLANRGQLSRIFEELYRYTPGAVSISQMKYVSRANRTSVDMKGQADSLSSAFEYADAMGDAKLLDKIQIINVQQIPRPGGSVVEFKANCIVRSE